MNLRKRVFTVAVLAGTAFGGLGGPAMAAPMPWETSRTPTVITHDGASTAVGHSGTVTARCGAPCYQ